MNLAGKSLLRRTALYPLHSTTRPELSPFFGPPATCDSMAHAPRAWHGAAIASATVQRHLTAAAAFSPRPSLRWPAEPRGEKGFGRAGLACEAGVFVAKASAANGSEDERQAPLRVCLYAFGFGGACGLRVFMCPPLLRLTLMFRPHQQNPAPLQGRRRKGTQMPTRVIEKSLEFRSQVCTDPL